MAIDFRVQGVDLSGLGAGIAQGLQQASVNRQRRELIAQEQLKDFEKNYDTKKIRGRDIPEFLMAFEKYKKVALEYSKLNNSNANSAKLALAEEAKYRAMKDMNEIYTNSATANTLLEQRNQYVKQIGQAKYSVPDEVADEINVLTTTPASQLNFENFKNPYEIDLAPGVNDYQFAEKAFKNLKTGYEFDEDASQEYTINKKKVKVTRLAKYQGAKTEDAINTARTVFQGNSKLRDDYKKSYENLMAGLSIPPNSGNAQLEFQRQSAIANLENIQKTAGNWVNAQNLTPEIMLANSYNAFSRQLKGFQYDDAQLKNEFKLAGIKDKEIDNQLAQFKAEENVRHNLKTENLSAQRFEETQKMNKFRMDKAGKKGVKDKAKSILFKNP